MSAEDNRNKEDQEHMQQLILNTAPEPHICKQFGCGHKLTPQDRLFGDHCPEHSKKKKWDITNTIKLD